MKFFGNPSADLGIEYHSFSELEDRENPGKKIIRYVLSGITPEQEKEIAKYENLRLVKDGATYRYAPEIKYPVLYVSLDEEETAEEEIEEDEIISRISPDLENETEELARYTIVSQCMENLNSQIILYKQLSIEFPDNEEIFSKLEEDTQKQLGMLSSVINKADPSVGENMNAGLQEAENISGTEVGISEESVGEGELGVETTWGQVEDKIKELVTEIYNENPNYYFEKGYGDLESLLTDSIFSEDSILPYFDEGFDEEDSLKILNSSKGKEIVDILLKLMVGDIEVDQDTIYDKLEEIANKGLSEGE